MDLISPQFAGLTGVLLVFYYLMKKQQWVVLLIGSLCFFGLLAKGIPVLVILMALLAYGYGMTAKKTGKAGLAVTVVLELLILILFRHVLSIPLSDAYGLAPADGIGAPFPAYGVVQKILPLLGISFYTMTAAAYCIDVRRGTIAPERNFAKLLLFLCYYPALLQGPIHRYGTFSKELFVEHGFDLTNLTRGCQRILLGLAKKLILVPRLRLLPDLVFGTPETANGASILLGTVLFLAELYTDWTGYMDLVLGVSELFGIKMEENFRRPFFAGSLSEFWKRWHMTLTAWFRDYVYIPLGGSRVTALWTILNVAAVWLLTGLWHGASGGYLLWALYFWLFSCIGILLRKSRKNPSHTENTVNPMGTETAVPAKSSPGRPHIFKTLGLWILVAIGFFFFACADFKTVVTLFSRIRAVPFLQAFSDTKLTLAMLYQKKDVVLLGVGMAAFFVLSLLQEKGIAVREKIAGWALPVRWVFWLAAVFFVILFGVYGTQYDAAAFLYQEF